MFGCDNLPHRYVPPSALVVSIVEQVEDIEELN